MPTYEYRCEACKNKFEKFQSITSEPIRKCPKCGKNKVRRLIGTGGGVIFKGSGFYETDYRDAAYKDKVKNEPGAESKPSDDAKPADGAKPATAESKPAESAETKTESKSEGDSKPKPEPKKSKAREKK